MKKIFGTDGVRGKANVHPMTPEMVLQIGKAVAYNLKTKNAKERYKIVIGKDTRLSGYMIESALTSGICSAGVDVLLVGPMPTPAIAHLTKSLNADAGVVISASHNPAEDNGIKIFSADGYKLPDETEQEIEKLIENGMNSEHINGDKIGKAYRIDDARGRYIEFAKSSIKNMSLRGLTIVLDCANGAAYSVAPKIFSELGAKVIVLNDQPNGLNINLNCGALYPDVIREEVLENNADIGIAFDGDADRVIVCDENGTGVDGDHILAICAVNMKNLGKLKKNTIVATVMSNMGLDEAMREHGINVVKAPVGDRYVIEEMRREGYVLGGEQSGHIIFKEYSTTGDGIITALQLLKIMKTENKKLSELSKIMRTYPQILINVDVREKRDLNTIPTVSEKIKEMKKTLGSSGRILVRYSGTQNICRVMVEGKNEKDVSRIAREIANVIKEELGV
jgi:phosphoglucosamine mutase